MLQSLMLRVMVLGLTWLILYPILEHVAQSMDDSANMIAEVSTHTYQGDN